MRIKDLFANPYILFASLDRRNMINWLDDKTYLKLMYRAATGRKLDLRTPKLFNEKLQWLKLYDRNPMYTVMADKVKAKDYVAERIGRDYIIPTLGVWDDAADVDFGSLPERFVIKCNHNSGNGIYICRDRSMMDEHSVRDGLRKGLAGDYYKHGREWPYKDIPRRILAEQYMEDESGCELKDYKFFCFNGEPRLCQVISDRTTDEKIDFYDMDWGRVKGLIGLVSFASGIHNSKNPISCPDSFDEMKRCASILSRDIPFSRIDFYDVNGKAYWGEITFFPASGMGFFIPDEYNLKIGSWIELPE